VGHTHNGNDSVHNCHNNVAGNFHSVTLAEFLRTFIFAWTNPDARPQPVFFDSIYDWERFYKPHMNYVSGFTKTSHTEMYVRALKFEVGKSGFVEMKVKGSPSNPVWKGVGEADERYPDAEGFVILKSYPPGIPCVLPKEYTWSKMHAKANIRQFANHKMLETAESVGLQRSLKWLCQVIETATLPTKPLPPDTHVPPKAQGWGQVEVIGVSDRTYNLPIVRPLTCSHHEFFDLTEELEAHRLSRIERLEHVRRFDVEAGLMHYSAKKKGSAKKKSSGTKKVQKRLKQVVSDSSDADDEELKSIDRSHVRTPEKEVKELEDDDDWRCSIEDCKPNVFAAVHALYGNEFGLSIVKVVRIKTEKGRGGGGGGGGGESDIE
jgi:hypothetical protein